MNEETSTTETSKKTFTELFDSPEMEKIRKSMDEYQKQYKKDVELFWDNLSYDDKLKAFFYVCSKIHQADVEDMGSYRHCLYSVFGFRADSYTIGMDANYLNLHNYIYDGVEFNKFKSAEEVEFRSGDVIHRFPISHNERIILSFDEESNQLLITTEEKWHLYKDE